MSIFGSDEKAIQVIAELKAKSGKEDEVRKMFTALVAPSQKEDGCKVYHLHQDTKDPGHFFTYEEWTSEDALHTHLNGAKEKLDAAKPLLDGELKITVLKLLA